MNPKVLLIALTGLLAVFGGGAMAYLWFITPQSVGDIEPTPTVQTPTQQNPTTQVPNPQTTTTEPKTPLVDVQKETSVALTKLIATKIQFVPVTASATSTLGELYGLYNETIESYKKAFPNVTDPILHIALVDLNGDEVQEGVVYVDLPGYCGSAGCALDIYTKEGKVWNQISSLLAYDTVATLKSMSNGFKDILLSVQGTQIGSETRLAVFGWNTEEYVEAFDAAVWDGATFDIK